MSVEHTIVVRYEGQLPRYHASMKFEGGEIVALAFDGNRLNAEEVLTEALENLLELAECAIFNPDAFEEIKAARAALDRTTGRGPM